MSDIYIDFRSCESCGNYTIDVDDPTGICYKCKKKMVDDDYSDDEISDLTHKFLGYEDA